LIAATQFDLEDFKATSALRLVLRYAFSCAMQRVFHPDYC